MMGCGREWIWECKSVELMGIWIWISLPKSLIEGSWNMPQMEVGKLLNLGYKKEEKKKEKDRKKWLKKKRWRNKERNPKPWELEINCLLAITRTKNTFFNYFLLLLHPSYFKWHILTDQNCTLTYWSGQSNSLFWDWRSSTSFFNYFCVYRYITKPNEIKYIIIVV
jgi:hypothetical protein